MTKRTGPGAPVGLSKPGTGPTALSPKDGGRAPGKGLPLEKAVDAAVIYCIRRGGKLAEFMRKHKAEASGMYLFGVDFEKIHWEAVEREAREAARKAMFEEGRRDGLAKGLAEAREESLRNLMDSMKLTVVQAMDALKIPEEEREKYAAMLAQEA